MKCINGIMVKIATKIEKFEDDMKKHKHKLDAIKNHIDTMSTELKKIKPKS
ncbi:MAG: hypothetical protein WCC55_00845 [Nitrosotalea sp.]